MFDEVLTTNQQVVWALGWVASLRSARRPRSGPGRPRPLHRGNLVVESLRRAGLEEDPRAALLDDLVILRRP
jgi:hypothetical protein